MKVLLASIGLLLAFGLFASLTLSGCDSLDTEVLLQTGIQLEAVP